MDDSSTDCAPSPSGPHPRFAHIMLKRKNQLHVRRPLIADTESDSFAQLYWQGGQNADWASLKAEVAGPRDIGILVERSGLVVIDCDVKHYEAEVDFEINQNTAQLVTTRESHTEYGLLDLAREVKKLGHDMDELTTYTVRTKSDGRHLYFWQNSELPLTGKGHRHEWHIDVKASENQWVVAPPTEGYWVIGDHEVATMPFWLAQWLQHVNLHLDPVGGRRTRLVRQKAKEARASVYTPGLDNGIGSDYMQKWVAWELQAVADAERLNHNWNNAIFETAANLFDGGWLEDDIIRAIEQAAMPRTARDRNLMLGTIASARRTTLGR